MSTPEYHKIQSVYKRDPANNYRTFLQGAWSTPEIGYLSKSVWHATEKVDGTNMRIHIKEEGHGWGVSGKTDKSEIPAELSAYCAEIGERASANDVAKNIVLFGEGYGAKIQKGEGYADRQEFILFDVMDVATGTFIPRSSVNETAEAFGIKSVGTVWKGTLLDAVEGFERGDWISSALRAEEAEGWVLRPAIELLDYMGRRIITKIKTRDFPERRSPRTVN